MNKHKLALLLIMSPTFTYAMESDSSFLSSFSFGSYLPKWSWFNQLPQESILITNLRENKDNFKNNIRPSLYHTVLISGFNLLPKTDRIQIIINPNGYSQIPDVFLGYCFNYCAFKDEIIKDLDNNIQILNICQNSQIDGYSGIGAILVSENKRLKEKCIFIQELLNRGFKPTPKDRELAALILYDEISTKQKEKIILLLCENQKNNSSELLPEIRKYIALYMIQLFKKEFSAFV